METTANETAKAEPVRRSWRPGITVLGMLGLVALAALALLFYRRHLARSQDRPSIVATFKRVSPVADGVIAKEEYGPPVTMTWSEGDTLAAFHHELVDPQTGGLFRDPTQSKQPNDLVNGLSMNRWASRRLTG
jgi:hypothetical protein